MRRIVHFRPFNHIRSPPQPPRLNKYCFRLYGGIRRERELITLPQHPAAPHPNTVICVFARFTIWILGIFVFATSPQHAVITHRSRPLLRKSHFPRLYARTCTCTDTYTSLIIMKLRMDTSCDFLGK